MVISASQIGTPAKGGEHDPQRPGTPPGADLVHLAAGFTFIEILVTMLILAVLAVLAIPSYGILSQRLYNATALSDVVNTGKALEAIDGTFSLSLTVTGPQTIPGLAGPRVSEGSTLYVRRSADGETYVRGSHRGGSAIYYFDNGSVYATGAAVE